VGEFHALIVEGVPGIGKSTVVDALIRRHVDSAEPRRIRSFLHLSQSHTYGPLAPFEDSGTLTVAANLALLERICSTVEWMCADLQYCDKAAYVVIESLHLTHCLRPGVLAWGDVVPMDARLARIGCKLLLLTGSEETIWDRSIAARAGSQFLAEYARKFGRTDRELHAHFAGEQSRFVEMFGLSALEKRKLENDRSLDTIVDEAYSFWVGNRDVAHDRSKAEHA
jgi:hypothetical protein